MKTYYFYFLFLLLGLTSCSEDTDPLNDPLIVSTKDLTFDINEGVENGTLIGELNGSSNKGSVSFSIVSQSPEGVVELAEDNNRNLIVANSDLIDAMINPTIKLVIGVTKDDITKNADITIKVNNDCPMVDLSTFATTLNIQTGFGASFNEFNLNVPQGSNYIGTPEDCGILVVTGRDPLGYADSTDRFEIQFIPSDDNPNMGRVTMEFEYGIGFFRTNIMGTGTYDSNAGVIQIVYDDGEFDDNLIEINILQNGAPDKFDCRDNPDFSRFVSSNLSIAVGSSADTEAITATNLNGTLEDCIITITGENLFGLSCDDDNRVQEIILAFEQNALEDDFETPIPGVYDSANFAEFYYECLGIVIRVSGRFTEETNEIKIDWDYFDGAATIRGTGTIRPN